MSVVLQQPECGFLHLLFPANDAGAWTRCKGIAFWRIEAEP